MAELNSRIHSLFSGVWWPKHSFFAVACSALLAFGVGPGCVAQAADRDGRFQQTDNITPVHNAAQADHTLGRAPYVCTPSGFGRIARCRSADRSA